MLPLLECIQLTLCVRLARGAIAECGPTGWQERQDQFASKNTRRVPVRPQMVPGHTTAGCSRGATVGVGAQACLSEFSAGREKACANWTRERSPLLR